MRKEVEGGYSEVGEKEMNWKKDCSSGWEILH